MHLGRAPAPGAPRLGAAFVGTIHAYCFRLLQQYVPRYETFDVLDERRLTAFLCREEPALGLKSLTGKLFASIRAFLANLEVIENELIPLTELDEPLRGMAGKFYELLEQFRLLTYGQLISRAVAELEKPVVKNPVHATLRHLIDPCYAAGSADPRGRAGDAHRASLAAKCRIPRGVHMGQAPAATGQPRVRSAAPG